MAASVSIVEVGSSDFQTQVLASGSPVVVDFWAPWCAPCRMLAPELEKLAEELGSSVKVVKLNVDEHPDIAATYGVMGIPTVVRFQDGKEASRFSGARPVQQIKDALGL